MNIGKTTENLLAASRDYLSKIFNGRTCIGSETIAITDSSTVKSLTSSIYSGATSAEITVEVGSTASTITNAAVRYSLSATSPTSTAITGAGVPLGDFDTIEILGGNNIAAFKVIGMDAVSKALKVQYFK
jgi:hypothetical protein